MNLITHNKAYSIFPRETFEERRSLVYANHPESAVQARAKYEQRGWQFIAEVQTDESSNSISGFTNGSRHLGDSKCWTIPLIPEIDYSPKYWEANSWQLHYDSDSRPVHIWEPILNQHRFSLIVDLSLIFRALGEQYEDQEEEQ